MTAEKINLKKVAPVLMGFFVMSFVDLVGIGVDRVSKDMSSIATGMTVLIACMIYLWAVSMYCLKK